MTARGRDQGFVRVGQTQVVTIVGVTSSGSVMVTDGFGMDHEVQGGWRAKGTAPPKADETWTLIRERGGWRLGQIIGHPDPIVITGDRSSATADVLRQVLVVLEAYGLIDDQTVA